jgi:hypothetical protein
VLINAAFVFDEDQTMLGEFETFCVELSLNVKVAVKLVNVPGYADADGGVIAKDLGVAGPTVKFVDLETPPMAAVMTVSPTATEVARPWVPEALLIVAMPGTELLQVAVVVTEALVPLL